MNKAYIGITGISTRRELSQCILACNKYGLSRSDTYQLMAGFLISHRFFKDGSKYPHKNRYVSIETLFDLLSRITFEENIFKAIHYNTPNESFSKEVIGLLEMWGVDNIYTNDVNLSNLIDGIQLNIKNPSIDEINKIQERFPNLKIIIQLNTSILNNPELIKAYENVGSFVLVDASMGRGRAIDLISTKAINTYKFIQKTFKNHLIGFAGGFDGSNIYSRMIRIKEFLDKPFCIDSESRLRTESDMLDVTKMESYLSESMKAIREMKF